MALRVLLALAAAACARADSLCDLSYCECEAALSTWRTVNCTLPPQQDLHILEGALPNETSDLIVQGGQNVQFYKHSLSHLQNGNSIKITGSYKVVIGTEAAVEMDINSLLLEVDGCNELHIEDSAYSKIKGTLSVQVTKCRSVTLGKKAFSWLLSITISDVHQLNLKAGTFLQDRAAKSVSKYKDGPTLTIALNNLKIPEIMNQTFGSMGANVTMRNVEVDTIRGNAFSANLYNMIIAEKSTFNVIQSQAFAMNSQIKHLKMDGCRVGQWAYGALQSAFDDLNISSCWFDKVETGGINITVSSVTILNTTFKTVASKGIELGSWIKLKIERNTFHNIGPSGILAPGGTTSPHELVFIENSIEESFENSLGFVGKANKGYDTVRYANNYFGERCNCNISSWLQSLLSSGFREFTDESHCTLYEPIAECLNIFEPNIILDKFYNIACGNETNITCESHKKFDKGPFENPRFPNKAEHARVLSEKNIKILGIVIVSILGCILIVLLISLVKWLKRRREYESNNNFMAPQDCCSNFRSIFTSRENTGIGNAVSVSQLSIHDYSERRRLNEPRAPDYFIQDTRLEGVAIEEPVATADKVTQTLPEQLTKELLENLKEKLEDPLAYSEAREMVEHLYELIKVEEACNENPSPKYNNENIYELPFVNTTPRRGKNNKTMVSVGTKIPSLDNLLPLSPYYMKTALSHEYFEPKDLTVHLYAEIMNSDREKNHRLDGIPDVVAEQVSPRGPYLRAVCEKKPNPYGALNNGRSTLGVPHHTSSIKSNKSTLSNSSAMLNRPLPHKPRTFDPGEGTSSHIVKPA